jgi:ribosome recycling factor
MSTLTQDTYKSYEERMQTSLSYLQEDLNTVRAGRANPRVLDQIHVSYYGVDTPLNQVAAISVPEARQLLIAPWDKTLLKEIEKAIQASDIGINPQNDGSQIRLTFPALTEERRRDLTKQVNKMGEETKVAIRNIRRDFLDMAKKLQKNADISEDQYHDSETKIQELTDKYTDEVDKMVSSKSEELMAI